MVNCARWTYGRREATGETACTLRPVGRLEKLENLHGAAQLIRADDKMVISLDPSPCRWADATDVSTTSRIALFCPGDNMLVPDWVVNYGCLVRED